MKECMNTISSAKMVRMRITSSRRIFFFPHVCLCYFGFFITIQYFVWASRLCGRPFSPVSGLGWAERPGRVAFKVYSLFSSKFKSFWQGVPKDFASCRQGVSKDKRPVRPCQMLAKWVSSSKLFMLISLSFQSLPVSAHGDS